jgi:glycosyltransferase involved in cell wall biosynthesis
MTHIVFFWWDFLPYHVDRFEAAAKRLAPSAKVTAIGMSGPGILDLPKRHFADSMTLLTPTEADKAGVLTRTWRLLSCLWTIKPNLVFFCHYEKPETFIAACLMRLMGIPLAIMQESKFDDYQRHLWREVGKWFLYLPYQFALVGSRRTREYLRFFGFDAKRIFDGFDTVSVKRLAASAALASPTEFKDRPFLIPARLVPKKNIATALQAYRLFLDQTPRTEPPCLDIAGIGPLDTELKALSAQLGLDGKVRFLGLLQSDHMAMTMNHALALLLPSTEEQFGLVINEAIAANLPVIVSDACGARDHLVRSFINGFVVEPDNPQGMASFMRLVAEDQPLRDKLASNCHVFRSLADVENFGYSVAAIVQTQSKHLN